MHLYSDRRWDRNKLSKSFKYAIDQARANALLWNQSHAQLHHLLLALVNQPGSLAWQTLQAKGVEYKHLYAAITSLAPIKSAKEINSAQRISDETTQAIYHAIEVASSLHRKIIDADHLFLGALRVKHDITRLALASLGFDQLSTYRLARGTLISKRIRYRTNGRKPVPSI
jgi:ATP-dependent Clp protease ATP-binding subunit ClpA